MRCARLAANTKASRISAIAARLNSAGGGSPGNCGSADGPTGTQPPASAPSNWPPCQGRALEALRPAWANWMHTGMGGASWRARCKCSASAAWVRSSHRPRQPGVIRPVGNTAVASMVNRPAPLLSRLPQCIRCQSFAAPSFEAYWHIGAITMRLASVKPPLGEGNCKGEKSRLMQASPPGRPGQTRPPFRGAPGTPGCWCQWLRRPNSGFGLF